MAALVTVLVAAVVVAAVTVIGAASGSNGSGADLALPRRTGGYTLLDTDLSSRMITALRAGLSSRADLAPSAIGVYGSAATSAPTMVFYGVSARSNHAFGSLLGSQTARAFAEELFVGSGIVTSSDADPGPLGGAMRCAAVHQATTDAAVCVWVDGSTMGDVTMLDGLDLGNAASVTRQVRADSEH